MGSRYGEGSVFYDDRRGLWTAIVELGFDEHGKRQRKWVRARTKAQVLAKKRDAQRHVDDGLPAGDARMTTGAWLEWWLDNVLPGTVAESTAQNYADVARAYVTPYVGHVPLVNLGPEHVLRMMRALERRGRKPRTVTLARKVLRRALADAQRFDKVHRNAASLVRSPQKPPTRLDDALDADQADQVLATARGDRLEALAVVVLALGLRQGEALALRWPDVDLRKATLHVADAKTKAGVRTVALPAFVVDALGDHRARQREERIAADVWDDPDLVFASTIGTRLDRRNVLRWWHALTERAGVGRRRFHASRHTAATLMLNNGVSLEVVSATLGHAGLAITADVYAKVKPELQRTAADTMQHVLGTSTS